MATTILTILSIAMASSTATSVATSDAPKPKRWTASSFTLELENTEPFIKTKDVETALRSAATTWNMVGAGTEIQVERAHGEDEDGDSIALDGVNRVTIYRGSWPYPPQAGAVTVAWARKTAGAEDEVVEADLALNPAFDWSLDHGDSSGLYDLKNVLTHELGHALGLPDIKDPRDATMFYLILPGETLKRDLTGTDTSMLLKLYDDIDDGAEPGCNAAGGETTTVGAALLLSLLAVRRRRSSK